MNVCAAVASTSCGLLAFHQVRPHIYFLSCHTCGKDLCPSSLQKQIPLQPVEASPYSPSDGGLMGEGQFSSGPANNDGGKEKRNINTVCMYVCMDGSSSTY